MTRRDQLTDEQWGSNLHQYLRISNVRHLQKVFMRPLLVSNGSQMGARSLIQAPKVQKVTRNRPDPCGDISLAVKLTGEAGSL
jgi:hypothetical protein